MAGGLTERDELFLNLALEQRLLTTGRIFALRQDKLFYPDKTVGEIAISKGFLNARQVEALYQLAEEKNQTTKVETPQESRATVASPPEGARAPESRPAAGPPPVPEPPRAMPRPAAPPTPVSPALPRPAAAVPPRRERPLTPVPSGPPPAEDRPPVLSDKEVLSFTRLDQYLAYARAKQATDLHLSTGYPPFIRRFGRFCFLEHPPLEGKETKELFFAALNPEQQAALEKDLNLECALEVEGQGRYRSTIIRQRLGWDGSFRVIQARVPGIAELGLPESVVRLADYRQGMLLLTGPGGSGKTTTMAALVDHVNAVRHEHIITLEQPIEYHYEVKKALITQRQVGTHTESYKRALRAALREDPDVIMMGEMRDLETISMAITAAETGHLIFATLHTTTAARTISRILDSFPPHQQPQIRTMIAESLRGIICQQLVPRVDREGVALAAEILVVTPGISSLIREMKLHQVASAIQTGKRLGMQRMDDSLMELYQQGAIAVEEAYARAEDKRLFAPLLPT